MQRRARRRAPGSAPPELVSRIDNPTPGVDERFGEVLAGAPDGFLLAAPRDGVGPMMASWPRATPPRRASSPAATSAARAWRRATTSRWTVPATRTLQATLTRPKRPFRHRGPYLTSNGWTMASWPRSTPLAARSPTAVTSAARAATVASAWRWTAQATLTWPVVPHQPRRVYRSYAAPT